MLQLERLQRAHYEDAYKFQKIMSKEGNCKHIYPKVGLLELIKAMKPIVYYSECYEVCTIQQWITNHFRVVNTPSKVL